MTSSTQFPRCFARFDIQNVYNETREVSRNRYGEEIKEKVPVQMVRNKKFEGSCEEVFRKMEEHRPDFGQYSKTDGRRLTSGEIFLQFTPKKIEVYNIKYNDYWDNGIRDDFTQLWVRIHDYLRKDRLERIVSGLSDSDSKRLQLQRSSDLEADSAKSPWKVFG
jgi:hypothetical protein